MAVPTSGTLDLEELAREAYYGQYGGSPTTYPITPPIFLYDLVNGGNSAGSGMSYPLANDSCTPNPIERTHQAIYLTRYLSTGTDDLRYTSRAQATDIQLGDPLYHLVNGSYVATSGHNQKYYILNQGNFLGCAVGSAPVVGLDVNGEIYYFACETEPSHTPTSSVEVAPPYKMSDWYGYDKSCNPTPTFYAHTISSTTSTTQSGACSLTPNTQVYCADAQLGTGSTLYINSSLTVTYNGGNRYHAVTLIPNGKISWHVSTSGVLSGFGTICV